jgi:hypothetical protein
MSAPGSTALKAIPDPPAPPPPPRLSTFKRRGGVRNRKSSFLRLRFRCPDQRRQGSHVLLSCPVFNPVWALLPSLHSSFRFSPAAVCHPFIPPLGSAWLSLLPTIHSLPAMRPVPLHDSLSPEGEIVSPVFSPPILVSSAMDHPPPLLSVITHTSRRSFHTLPQCHRSCHTPCPPRWPSGPTLKLFSCSRCQCEKSSLSRGAELAWPFSIPRSSYWSG